MRERLIHDEHRFIAVAQEGSYRDFRIAQECNTGFAMRGRTGSVQGAQIEEIVRHFERAEFRADWAAAVEQHGEGNITKEQHSRSTAEATAAALIGRCRRAVINAAGVTINMSRESRLFKGSSRLAVQLMDCDCHFNACETDITDCQIDHLTPWAQQHDGTGGGATNPDNGAGACPKHNRYKSVHSYTTWRDPTGKWHTYRPDGTEIQ